jgi:hypothetical protein
LVVDGSKRATYRKADRKGRVKHCRVQPPGLRLSREELSLGLEF